MFDALQRGFSRLFQTLQGQKSLTPERCETLLKKLDDLLIEADVALPVVEALHRNLAEHFSKEGVTSTKELTLEQRFMEVVQENLAKQMGDGCSAATFDFKGHGSTSVILLVGLQGHGKTTTTVKLAHRLKQEGRRPLLVSLDLYRPAARKQLAQLCERHKLPFWEGEVASKSPSSTDVLALAAEARSYAEAENYDLLVVDTAGRNQEDHLLMEELQGLEKLLVPHQTLMVLDGMLGQNSWKIVTGFRKALRLTGAILTKMDSGARGGVALSLFGLTALSIAFIGTGEKVDDFELFEAKAMARRIMGMGDLWGLIDEIKRRCDGEKIEQQLKNKQGFDLDAFRLTLDQIDQLGGMSRLLDRLPSNLKSRLQEGALQQDPKILIGMKAIMSSMTAKERKKPQLLNGSRKRRIAQGSGRSVSEVQLLLKQFEAQRQMMQQFENMGSLQILSQAKKLFGF